MRRRSLRWGPELVSRLLPQRRPFLMVDTIDDFRATPSAELTAHRAISANEPVFDGHFPRLALWPGVYTIEALAQATQLMLTLATLTERHPGDEGGLRDDLTRLCRAMRMEPVPGGPPDLAPEWMSGPPSFGLLVAVDIKLKHPVFAGDTLHLDVRTRDRSQGMWRVAAEATVGTRSVASGRLTVAPREAPPGFGPTPEASQD